MQTRTWMILAGLGLMTLAAAGCGHKAEPETPTPVADHSPHAGTTNDDAERRAREAEAARRADAARAALGEPVHFGYDRADLSAAARDVLERKVVQLQSYPDVRLEISGHADERGSDEYNLALGMRRATAARRYLAGQGVDDSRFTTVSRGEEEPAVDGHDEQAWTANRRDEFSVTAGQLVAGR